MIDIEWDQNERDQLAMLMFQMSRMFRSPYYLSARRKLMLTILAVASAPVLVTLLSNWDDQDAISIIGIVIIYAMLLYFLVIKKPSNESLDRRAFKEAERYLSALDVIPVGPHRFRVEHDRAEWEWVGASSVQSFPVSLLTSVVEQDGYVHLVRPNYLIYSIPYHAFGDQATRERAVAMIQSHLEVNGEA